MSSEHDESAELLDELSVKSDAERSGSPSPKKSHGDPAKPKRKARRGKKRKQRKDSGGAMCESENQEESEAHPETEDPVRESPKWDSDQELDGEINAYNDVIIRPINVPKAPENSTQFIIDDHNECRLYMSFETPNPYLSSTSHPEGENGHMITEPIAEDAAYIDIDYEYESPQDFDNSAYYDREFELSYKSNRFDELLRLPRSELISGLHALESRLKELSDDLLKENPSPILEKLQAELLELQEKHVQLKESNSKLTAQVMKKEAGCSNNASAEESNSAPPESRSDVNPTSPKNEKQSDNSVDKNMNADSVVASASENAGPGGSDRQKCSVESVEDSGFTHMEQNSIACEEVPDKLLLDESESTAMTV